MSCFTVHVMMLLKNLYERSMYFPVSFGNRFKSKRSSAVEFHEAFLKLNYSMSVLLLHS